MNTYRISRSFQVGLISKIDNLHGSDFEHVGAEPIRRLNKTMRDLLEAQKTENVLAFDLGLEIIEGILREVESSVKSEATTTKKIKREVADKKTKDSLSKAMSGRLRK